eukprot:TRINITY_DN4700_c0_g2_i1.p1 TRINITY_DN4700_c0_g2~~TRINITY_DN4700_c0_g2_i1.p1  ORF type:complete len:346 (+),score=35.22 TRINITY_DN4700_c0_g2_i1:43-1080(+)
MAAMLLFTVLASGGDPACMAEFQLCILNTELGRCFGGYCALSKSLPGCLAHDKSISCDADTTCKWKASSPAACSNGGCPNANCATLSTDQINSGFTCDNCFIKEGYMFCGQGIVPGTGICEPTQITGQDPCRTPPPVRVYHNGNALTGSVISRSELTDSHTEILDAGYVKGFSKVVLDGDEDGHVFKVPHDALVSGEDLTFDCPSSCSKECEVYVVAYHCPSCPKSMKNKVVADALSNGWEMSSCAPELYVTGDDRPQPMVSMRKVLQPGQQHTFSSSGDVTNMFVMSFSRHVADCTSLELSACTANVECRYHNNQCTAAWCQKRFSRGPYADASGPGCSRRCVV